MWGEDDRQQEAKSLAGIGPSRLSTGKAPLCSKLRTEQFAVWPWASHFPSLGLSLLNYSIRS